MTLEACGSVFLDGQSVALVLTSADGFAEFRFDAGELTRFVSATYDAVGADEATAIVHAAIDDRLAGLFHQTGGLLLGKPRHVPHRFPRAPPRRPPPPRPGRG